MGLDIVNNDSESYCSDMAYWVEDYIAEEHQHIFTELIDNGEYDKILSTVALEHIDSKKYPAIQEESYCDTTSQALESFKERIEYVKGRIDALKDPETTEEDLALAKEYEWIFEMSEVQDSRMGSYSTIHYGRKFVDLVDDFYRSIDMNLPNFLRKLTKDETESLLSRIESEGTTSYEAGYFDNFCNHADNEDVYIPTQERKDFATGSSILLLREIDTLWKTGAIENLEAIMKEAEDDYGGENNVAHAPEEVRTRYNLARTCLWVCRKMLYHATSSVMYSDAIVFC